MTIQGVIFDKAIELLVDNHQSKVVGHEEPVCEEVEGCADPHEGYGKRSAQFGFPGWTSFSIEIFQHHFSLPGSGS